MKHIVVFVLMIALVMCGIACQQQQQPAPKTTTEQAVSAPGQAPAQPAGQTPAPAPGQPATPVSPEPR